MKRNHFILLVTTFILITAASAEAKTNRHPAATSGPCNKEAVSAAKGFAADEGDEACAGEIKTTINSVVNQRSKKEWAYQINADCGGGTSFTETVILDASCKVLNPQ